jgi:LysM repeat protein
LALLEGIHHIYTVRQGDTLYSIAGRFGSTVPLLEQTNALFPPITDPGLVRPGQVLVVSEIGLDQRSNVSYIIQPGDSLYRIGQRFSANPEMLIGMNPLITNAAIIYPDLPLAVPALLYDVEEGDSLFGISRKLGVPMKELVQANVRRPGFSPDLLFIGFRLLVPLPSSSNIVVFRPLPGSTIRPGQAVEGLARVFEAAIQYQLIDDNGVIVTAEKALMTSAGAPAFGTFSTALLFDRQPTAESGELWIYARSARDGSIIDLVQIKVGF